MQSDGKRLEGLVSFVESMLLPQGFDVKTRERVYSEGVQVAEFDIEIRGKVGSGTIAWLIECRDRPSEGPAPGSWIEQLVGRRLRFGFNKITAVSTTGFVADAIRFAAREGIELREVAALEPEAFSDWILARQMHQRQNITKLESVVFLFAESETRDEAKMAALTESVRGKNGSSAILVQSKTGNRVAPIAAFDAAVRATGSLFEGIEPNTEGKKIRLKANYPDDEDHFLVETAEGVSRIQNILFVGRLIVRDRLVPISETVEYRGTETGEPISQVVSFSDQEEGGVGLALEFHKIAETGQTHVLLRKIGATSNKNLEKDG